MNSQNSILLIDPAFDLQTALNCTLLLRLGMDNFSYAILDNETHKISVVFDEQECENVVAKLSEQLKSDPNLGLTFTEIKLAIYTENNISIPNSLYAHDDEKLNANFFNQPHSGSLYTNPHPNFDFTSLFSFSKITDEIISKSLTNSKKYQPNAVLLKLAETMSDTSLLLDFTAGSISVLYVKDKKVVFEQGFEIENAEEFNYYLLLMINQLQINLNDTQVYLTGIIHESDDKHNCLTNYFKEIQFLNYVNPNLDQQILEDMPAHYYTTLLALAKCV